MPRLFIGIKISKELQKKLKSYLPKVNENIKLIPTQNYHITLDFIGEVDDLKTEKISKILDICQAKSFTLNLNHSGSFNYKKQGKILWLGVEANALLLELKTSITAALAKENVRPPKKSYHPHITIAKVRNKRLFNNSLWSKNINVLESFLVKEFSLFYSTITDKGVIYRRIKNYPLL